MSAREDLLAKADELGVKVDRRWGIDRLRQAVDDATTTATSADDEDTAPAPAVDDATTPVLDEWPKRIAPCVWLDQDGGRHTTLGSALGAVAQIRKAHR